MGAYTNMAQRAMVERAIEAMQRAMTDLKRDPLDAGAWARMRGLGEVVERHAQCAGAAR